MGSKYAAFYTCYFPFKNKHLIMVIEVFSEILNPPVVINILIDW
jgi:hypothetical protein